jgi:integrase
VPRLGKIAIRELTVPLCEQAYRDMLVPRRARDRSGNEYGEPREMTPAARNALGVMKKVLDRAVILGLRLDNPAAPVRPKKRSKKEIQALHPADLQKVRKAVTSYLNRPDRSGPTMKYLEFALDVMSGTGARIGEALAIRAVEDIDLLSEPLTVHLRGTIVDYRGSAAVRQELPKTDTSVRSI